MEGRWSILIEIILTQNFGKVKARDNGQTNAHAGDCSPLGNYHTGREQLFIILQRLPKALG